MRSTPARRELYRERPKTNRWPLLVGGAVVVAAVIIGGVYYTRDSARSDAAHKRMRQMGEDALRDTERRQYGSEEAHRRAMQRAADRATGD